LTRNIPENKIYVLVVKARTLEANTKAEATALKVKSKARALKAEAKVNDMIFCPQESSRPRPALEDYITDLFETEHISIS
jgi:hypothetical protein